MSPGPGRVRGSCRIRMSTQLQVSLGQHSEAGRKPINQDHHGACIPREPQLGAKGIAVALADGIGSSAVSHEASQAAVRSLLEDYYCTCDAWSVKTSVERVLVATNSWLYAQTQQGEGRFDKDRGHACTLSALVLKATTAHIFHVGDARIWQLHGRSLEPLTNDHRIRVCAGQSYLARALGIRPELEVDYRAVSLEAGDIFVLATDGVHEHVPQEAIVAAIDAHHNDLDEAARLIAAEALARGSPDNLTVQIVRVDALPGLDASEIHQRIAELPFPPLLEPRAGFDGYRIVREIHASSRSHIYLAVDEATGATVALKTPSIDLQGDPAYLERFLMEEWVARRISSAHVLKPCLQTRQRRYLYVASEYIEGRTLAQWMIDHPKPGVEAVRRIVEQIARGLRAFHRLEMVHQDLRPQNIMIDATGTVKIIDFGSTKVAGVVEEVSLSGRHELLGTAAYTAPECFLGAEATPASDLFSLAAIAYQMLTGRLPYGTQVVQCRTPAAQKRLQYIPVGEVRADVPSWIDEALRKALQPDPRRRQQDLPELVFDLQRPNPEFGVRRHVPLIERSPVVFWKGVSLVLGFVIVLLLAAGPVAR